MTFFYTLCIVLNCHVNEFKTTPSRSLIKSSLISFDFQKAAIATTSFFKISVNELVGNRRNKQWLEFSNLNLVFTFSMLLIASNLDTKVMDCKDDLWSLFIKTRNLVHFTNISVSIP